VLKVCLEGTNMLVNRPLLFLIVGVVSGATPARAQNASNDPAAARWNVYFQATSIGQHHGAFPSLYEGDNSLPPHPENRVSVTATVFLSDRLNSWTEMVVNPEVAGGKGFGQVTGMAGFTTVRSPASRRPRPNCTSRAGMSKTPGRSALRWS
jgi:hypothetical protein